MFVYNRCTTDARVLKEARTLADAGHEVRIIAVLDKETEPVEERGGFSILRIDRNPIHYRILRGGRRLRRALRLAWARTKRGVLRVLRRSYRLVIRAWRLARTVPARIVRSLTGREERGPEPGQSSASSARRLRRLRPVAIVLGVPFVLIGRGLRMLGSGIRATGGALGTFYRRALLRYHKPLMFGDYYLRAYRASTERHPDVVHAHDLNTLPAAAAVARRTGAQLVYDAHELYHEISTLSERERRNWRWIERRLIGRADAVITVCGSIADELVTRYAIAPPTILLNCPARGERLETVRAAPLREKAGIDDPAVPIVLFQGGFAPYRGLEALIRSAHDLRHGVIVLMGWGRSEDGLRRLVADEGLQQRVRITGPVPHDEVVAYTAAATVGVIPYEPVGLNNTYTTPNKLFDYMTVGLPTVGSRLPELVRFLEGEGIGLTFPPGDAGALAETLNALLEDPARRAGMRTRALAAARRYTWENESAKLLALYGHTASEAELPRAPRDGTMASTSDALQSGRD